MNTYIPIEKRCKKAQKQYYSKQRKTWGELNPVTKSVPNSKKYNRNKEKRITQKLQQEFNINIL